MAIRKREGRCASYPVKLMHWYRRPSDYIWTNYEIDKNAHWRDNFKEIKWNKCFYVLSCFIFLQLFYLCFPYFFFIQMFDKSSFHLYILSSCGYRFFLLDAIYGIIAQLRRHTNLPISTDNLTVPTQAMDYMTSVGIILIGWVGNSRRWKNRQSQCTIHHSQWSVSIHRTSFR